MHARIMNIRQDFTHKLTTDLIKRFGTIGIEDPNMLGMLKNRRLSRSISDRSFEEFRRQLENKAARAGRRIVTADSFHPSSKTCNECGHIVGELPLSVRGWTYPSYGSAHDGDANAAKNLEKMALGVAASACGGRGSGPGYETKAKPSPVKQEAAMAARPVSAAKKTAYLGM